MTAQSNITPESIVGDLRYLQLLSRSFPTIADASTEIINLEAILNLPKGTEHFLTDIHGEYEAFQHVLKNASGAVKRKVNEIFGNTLREAEKKELCDLLSGRENSAGKSPREGSGRLVSDHSEPVGEGLSECIFQIYPFQSSKILARRVLLHHSGITARNVCRAE